jgi:hypothetical protein
LFTVIRDKNAYWKILFGAPIQTTW